MTCTATCSGNSSEYCGNEDTFATISTLINTTVTPPPNIPS